MKKIIIFSSDFPGLGGSRIFKIVKYLPDFGVEPIVVTNNHRIGLEENKVIEKEIKENIEIINSLCMNKSPFRVFSKYFGSWRLTTFFENLFFIPDTFITWVPFAFLKGLNIIKKNNIDTIITSSPPESVHIIGLLLKLITGIKWVADFRDLWTTKKIVHKYPTKIHYFLNVWLEKYIYKKCDLIIANTIGNKKVYTREFMINKNKISIITNGYDPNDIFLNAKPNSLENVELRIGYMGFFDKPGFPWKEFVLEMKKTLLLDNKVKIMLNICGNVSSQAKSFIQEQGIREYVNYIGNITHSDAIKEMKRNHLLLLLMYETDYSKAIVPHKLYYYLGLKIPILAIAEKNGGVDNIITSTNTGEVISLRNYHDISIELKKYYYDVAKNGSINYSPNCNEIEKYNILSLTNILLKDISCINISV